MDRTHASQRFFAATEQYKYECGANQGTEPRSSEHGGLKSERMHLFRFKRERTMSN